MTALRSKLPAAILAAIAVDLLLRREPLAPAPDEPAGMSAHG